MVVYACNPSTWEARQDDYEFEANLGSVAIPCFKLMFLRFLCVAQTGTECQFRWAVMLCMYNT
jgi:hypothetical protein